jgi:hypothetical protein
MNQAAAGLDRLTRRGADALRALLVEATAVAGRPRRDGELERLVGAAPVEVLPAAAALHRVAGTVLRGLDGIDGVPPDVRATLAALRHHATLRHLLITSALDRIGRAFDGAALSWVVMKGPVLAALLYPEPGERRYSDLDLLVARGDFPRAVQVLEALGYGHAIHNWALADEMLAGQISMSDRMVSVDLHWHLHYSREDRQPFAIDPEAMIERRRRVGVSGLRVPTFDAVDTLLTLAFHAARSDGHRLIWLKDIERAVDVEAPDLDELVRRSRAFRCAPPVGTMVGRAKTVLDADVPDEIVRALAPAALRGADRIVTTLSHPVQLHERITITRAFTRSVRSSTTASVAAIPARGVRQLRRRLFPPRENETDNPAEKSRFLDAVSSSVDR